jgi:signal peptidase I
VAVVAVLLGVGLVFFFGLTSRYEIPVGSMLPTYEPGDVAWVKKWDKTPDVGDVVVFHPPAGADTTEACGAPPPRGAACAEPVEGLDDTVLIKRVVAVGGDTLRMDDGEAIVNGQPVTGDWDIRPCGGGRDCDYPMEITIPPDHYFLLGDNRGASDDSRFWGPVPADAIVGTAF